mgnify:CR=1 FL=1
MRNFGIIPIQVKNDYLRKLAVIGCLPAYFVYLKRLKPTNWKDIQNKNSLNKRLKPNILNEIDSLNQDQQINLRGKFFEINFEKLSKFPAQSLVNFSTNNNINKKLNNLPTELKIGDIENAISSKNLKIKLQDTEFTNYEKKVLRNSILWLNWEMTYTRKENDYCFSKKVLQEMAVKKDTAKAINFLLSHKKTKNKKTKLKKIFNSVNFNQKISPLEFSLYLSSLRKSIAIEWYQLRKDEKRKLYDAFFRYKLDNYPKSYNKLPIYFLSQYPDVKISLLTNLYLSGFRKIEDLKFLDERFESLKKSKEESFLENAEFLYDVYS